MMNTIKKDTIHEKGIAIGIYAADTVKQPSTLNALGNTNLLRLCNNEL